MRIYFSFFTYTFRFWKLFLFLNLRYALIPLNKYFFEVKGVNILDFGCGHGIFSYFFSRKNLKLNIDSYDIDKDRIIFLKKLISHFSIKNIRVLEKIQICSKKKYDSIIIVGVLSLFEDKEISNIMDKFHMMINDDGIIIISEILIQNSIIYKMHCIRETFFKKINFTKGSVIKPRNFNEWSNLFKKSGFKIDKKININIFMHSTIDIVLKKIK